MNGVCEIKNLLAQPGRLCIWSFWLVTLSVCPPNPLTAGPDYIRF